MSLMTRSASAESYGRERCGALEPPTAEFEAPAGVGQVHR
jgi:hypothetical protein